MLMEVRSAEGHDLDSLAKVWYDSWNDAHARLVPAELTRLRTLENFRERLKADLPHIRVVGPPGAPVGLCMIKDDELFQLFVAADARGSGAAAALIADGEAQLARAGVETAWLACVVGNDRAARFYEKSGWRRVGTMINLAETPERVFEVEAWRYEKLLTR
jgi:GNAT superfamily N-acetyltransferase